MRFLSLLCLALAAAAADVTVHAGATGTGHLLTGAVLESASAPQPIIVDVTEITQPSGEKVVVHLRCIGEAMPQLSDQRILITIQKATTVAVDGRTATIPLKAWVVDTLKRHPGVPATYHTNAEQIVAAQVVANAQQVVAAQVATDTTTVADPAAQARADDYAKRVIDAIKPSVSVDNGMAVTVVFGDAATLTL